jgi:hypothetical protein
MGTTSNKSKQQWNAAHYTQIKISVNPEIAERFKEFCSQSGVSMASELSGFMNKSAASGSAHSIKTRNDRRKETRRLIQRLEQIRDAEELYQDNIPENLQSSKRYEDAEQSIALIEDAISALEDAY